MIPTTRPSQRYTWLPALIIAKTGVLVVAFLVALSVLEDRLIAHVGHELQQAAREVAEKLDLLLYERYGDISLLADSLARIKAPPNGGEWTALLKKAQQAYPLYAWIGALDATGRVVAATDVAAVGLDLGRTAWFRGLATGSAPRVHDVERLEWIDGNDSIGLSAPIRRDDRAESAAKPARGYGFIVTRLSTMELAALVTRTLRDIAAQKGYMQGLEYQILTTQGRLVVEAGPHPAASINLLDVGVESARRVLSGETGFVQEAHRRRGVPVITGYARMPARRELNGIGWGVLVRVDRAAVMGPIHSTLWTVTIVAGLLFFPMWGLLLWATRNLRQEWRRAQSATQVMTNAHAFLEASLDALSSPIAVLDDHGTILTVNNAWRLFGEQNQLRDAKHGVGRNYLELCESCSGEGTEEARRVAQGLRAILQGQEREWVGEYSCQGSEGPRWFVVRLSAFQSGGKLRVLVDHQDVTELRVACQAARESHETAHAILYHALDAHIVMDQEGSVVDWNPQAEAIFGWAAREAVGRPLANLIVPPGYREAHQRGLQRFLVDGVGLLLGKRIEIDGWHKEGRPFPIELMITAIKQPRGYVFSAFVRDRTEPVQRERRRQAEHRIAELLREAESFEAASPEILRVICSTLGWGLGVLWKLDEDRQALHCVALATDSPGRFESFVERTRSITFALGVGLPGRVWESGTGEWIPDVTQDRNFPRAPFAWKEGIRAAFGFPVKLNGSVHAVMEFFAEDSRPPDRALMDLFDDLAWQLSQYLERQTAERDLRRSEARSASMLRLAQDAIISVDDSQNIILFNQGAERIFGYLARDVLGQPLDLLLPARYRNTHGTRIAACGGSSPPSKNMEDRNEVVGLRKGGEEFPAEASTAKVTVDGSTTYTIILRDISRRKQEEQALRDAKASAEQAVTAKTALLAIVDVFFVGVDDRGVVCEWAGQAEKLFGIPLTEAVGTPLQELSIGWNWASIVNALEQATRTLMAVDLHKLSLVTHEGRQRFLKVKVSPLCRDSGVQVIMAGQDITDHLLLEHDLAQAQKLESIGQLAAGIAHEINTPTQFVGDNVRFLSDSYTNLLAVLDQYRKLVAAVKIGACAPDLIEACDTAVAQADLDYVVGEIPKAIVQSAEGVERIANIVRAMKDFAHPGSDEMSCIELNEAIKSTVTVSRNEWKYVADMTTDLAPDLPLVPCLVGQINQVILNLIVNAAHAIGDVVRGTGQKGLITISTRHVGEWVEIRVADTGTGIPENIRHRIFDPFFTTKEVGRGTGQGLAIARSVVVDKHRGTIAFDSQVGKGTTFIVRLPLCGTEITCERNAGKRAA